MNKFNVETGKQTSGGGGGPPTYTQVFADSLVAEAKADAKIQVRPPSSPRAAPHHNEKVANRNA